MISPLFGSDCDAQGVQMILDGEMVGHSMANLSAAVLADALLVNALDGHMIVDEEGNAPYLNQLNSFEVNADNAQQYLDYCINDYGISDEAFQQLCYRVNPDVSYDDFVDFAQNGFTYENVLAMHEG